MKPARALYLALSVLLAALMAAGGCAYTTVTTRERQHTPGAAVKADLRAVMGTVGDRRTWPSIASDTAIPNVRIFAPEMTDQVRRDLLRMGLFSALPAPGTPQARDVKAKLSINVENFVFTKLGTNAWVVPHLLINGLALPVFTGAALATKGKMDVGGYITPSTRMGTTLAARLTFEEEGLPAPVLERDYLVRVEMGEVSERQLQKEIMDASAFGSEVGRKQGAETLDLLGKTIASDPHWKFLPELRRLVKAEQVVGAGQDLARQAEAARGLLDMVGRPLTYTQDEVKVLRDGYLDAKARATIFNDIQAGWLGLKGVKDLPPDKLLSQEEAEKLFDDDRLPTYQVQAILAERVLRLVVQVITPEEPKAEPAAPAPTTVSMPAGFHGPASGVAATPAGPATPATTASAITARAATSPAKKLAPAQAQALRDGLSQELAKKVRADLRLQALLTAQADKAIGPAWPAMEQLLRQVDTPLTARYLKQRNS